VAAQIIEGESVMQTMQAALALATLLASFATQPVQAADYSESINGDISGDRFNPTRISLGFGVIGANGLGGNNIISGSLGSIAGVPDRDYFTAIVPPGFVLNELRVGNQTTVGGQGSFIGVAAGSVMPVPANTGTAAGLLGWRVYTLADRNTDILDNMAVAGNQATGFSAPLGAGEYTFWLQELAGGKFNYRFNLVVTPVPEPAPWLLLSAGIALLAWRGKARAVVPPAA